VNQALKSRVRPIALPFVHAWQGFWDYIRFLKREYSVRLREKLLNSQSRRQALRDAVPIVRDVNGARFVVYAWDRPSIGKLVRRSSDVSEFDAIPLLVPPGSIAMDIGANIGIYSVLLSRLCGAEGRVWAFEPVPDTYWRLVETLALNRCENVTPVRAAICEQTTTVRMNLFEAEFAEWNTMGRPAMPIKNGNRISPSGVVDVAGQTLDRFCDERGIKRINFLKVDVEGFEWAVFRGAQTLLQEGRIDHICFEISQDPLKGAGVGSRQVFEELEIHGYLAYRFDRARRAFTGPVRDTSEYWTNFFASRFDLLKIEDQVNRSIQSNRSVPS
jgi:FkbM family methyltransferase